MLEFLYKFVLLIEMISDPDWSPMGTRAKKLWE